MKKYHFYPKNIHFNNSEVNITFSKVLSLSDDEFLQWVKDVRKKIVDIWDTDGTPPLNGYTYDEIKDQFNALHKHDVSPMFIQDQISDDTCIRNTHNKLGNACNSWFPTMMKTRITYNATSEARSIYDFMKRDDLLDRYMPYAKRHFKKDSFYAYSHVALTGESLPNNPDIVPENGYEFIKKFEEFEDKYRRINEKTDLSGNIVGGGEELGSDWWLSAKQKSKIGYTGYNEDIRSRSFHHLTLEELKDLVAGGYVSVKSTSNIKPEEYSDDYVYQIRVYDRETKMFPSGLKSFRVSVCQRASNFPPLIAKALWEKYTEEFKNENTVYVFDPSSGWGGRILGAMSAKDDRNLFYLGCDPNTDHTISDGYTKYDDIAEFFNTETTRAKSLIPHAHEHKVWQTGSEVIQHDEEFQKYKGKVSVVFTSPPYFHREVYSEDATQSCHKFGTYEDWRDTFLYETLKTAYDWLRDDGYILWNISDIKEKYTDACGDVKDYIPLEQDSCDIMESLGFEYVETLKLVLAQMPGGNRTTLDENGDIVSTNKNSVRIPVGAGKKATYFRYEPIFVYRKVKKKDE